MKFSKESVYSLMPVFIQNIMISTFGLSWYLRRFGGVFSSYLLEVRKREYFTKAEWDNYQTLQLRKLLQHAWDHVPLYKEKYSRAGFSKSDFEMFELSDLKNLPFLEKEELRLFGTSALLSDKRKKGTFISSSGSSGTPTKIFLPYYFHQQWSAIMEARVRNWAGVNFKTPRGMIGGRRIIQDDRIKSPLYRYNIIEKQTYFSAYHISPNTVSDFLKGIKVHQVDYMTGYAMSNFLLAKFIDDKGLNAPKLKAVITSSEKLTKEMRQTIEKVYKCKVYDSYSGCEACGLISESPEGKLLFSPDSGILEVLNANGKDVKPGDTGEIVLTGLLNFDQPLIRYRIGDRCTFSKNQNKVGNREMPVIDQIEGRIEDVIIGKDGRAMVRFHALYVNIEGIKTAQLIQHDYDRFTINIVIDYKLYNKIYAEDTIRKRLISQIGDVNLQFNYPNYIMSSNNGKIKAVISELK